MIDPISATIAKEAISKATEKVVEKVAEKSSEVSIKYTKGKIEEATRPETDNPILHTMERLTESFASGKMSDAALATRMEAAAHSACKFFNLPEPDIIDGDGIAVIMNDNYFFETDIFQANLEQFKDMKCVSFEDMSKIWSHECGHRILRCEELSAWAQELGADYFMGVRSEMLGLPDGNIEKVLGSEPASASHPNGTLRTEAIKYGRQVAREFMKTNEPITVHNCLIKFMESDLSKVQDGVSEINRAAFIDDKAYHYKKAETAQSNANYYSKEAKKAADKGDFTRAHDMERKAQSYEKIVKEESQAAEKCTKLIDSSDTPKQSQEIAENQQPERHRCPKRDGRWDGKEGNSKFIPDDDVIPKDRNYSNPDEKTWAEIKDKYGIDGVTFKNGYPDFSEVSKGTVEIDNFCTERYGTGGNFDQADRKLAEQRGCTVEEVRQWRIDNNYTWHEMEDCKTMQKVPREVHGNIPHDGGISKLKNAE